MPTYLNGQLPRSILVELDSGGGKHWTTRASAARWYALRAWVKAEYGVTLKITEGWNAYRDLANQEAARQWACDRGNCLGAAYPSTSSHGGNWYRPGVGWVDAMAFDVGNWWLLTWDAWVKACARFGLLAGGIPLNVSGGVDERHHIIDLNPFGPVPAFAGVTPFSTSAPEAEKEEPVMEAYVAVPSGAVVHFAPGSKDTFTSQQEYETWAKEVEFIRARGGIDVMPVPPLASVVGVSWATYERLRKRFGAPSDSVTPPGLVDVEALAAELAGRLGVDAEAVRAAVRAELATLTLTVKAA